MTLHGVATFLTDPATRHPTFRVVDENFRVLGVVDPPTVLRWRRQGSHRKSSLRELLKEKKAAVAYPDDYLESLADKLNAANVSHLPVVDRHSSQLVGYIGWKDLMRVRTRAQSEEQKREAFFRVNEPKLNGDPQVAGDSPHL